VLIIVLGVLRLSSMLYMMQKLHDFRLVLIEGELRISFGLLTRVKATIPMRRIQAITVREGPLHRLFGVCSIRADTAGGAADLEAARSREWLAPVIRRADMPAFVRRVMPEADLESVSWQPAHPRAVRRLIVRPLLYALLVSAALVWPMGAWAAVPAVLLVALVLFRASRIVRHMGHALERDVFAFRSGWFWRHITVAPVRKVQAVAMHESPFDRRHGMAGLRVDTAGAAGGPHTLDVPFLPRASAAALSAALAGMAAESPLSW
jgi:putative membrane protein